jgi:hypothetical protein
MPHREYVPSRMAARDVVAGDLSAIIDGHCLDHLQFRVVRN